MENLYEEVYKPVEDLVLEHYKINLAMQNLTEEKFKCITIFIVDTDGTEIKISDVHLKKLGVRDFLLESIPKRMIEIKSELIDTLPNPS